jgi:serine/threonine protein kinase
VVLHELLTAEKPYVAETAMGVIYCHANAPIPRLPPDIARMQPLLDTLLAKDPADRPPTAAVIVTMIDELLAGVVA